MKRSPVERRAHKDPPCAHAGSRRASVATEAGRPRPVRVCVSNYRWNLLQAAARAAAPRWTTCGIKARVVGKGELCGKNLREQRNRRFRKGKQRLYSIVSIKKKKGRWGGGRSDGTDITVLLQKKQKKTRVSKLAWTGKKGMLKQKLGVSIAHERASAAVCMCTRPRMRRRQSSYSALSKQCWDYPSFHSQTIIRPKCPLRRGGPATHPEQDVGVWERREAVYGYGALAKYNTAPVSNKSHRRGVNHGGWLGEEGRRWGRSGGSATAIQDMFSMGLFSIHISRIYTRLRPAAELESVFRPGQWTSYMS